MLRSLILSFLLALFSIAVARRYFLDAQQMASCALTALGLSSLLSALLEKNRKAIWEQRISPWLANRVLAFEFCSIFVGIFAAAVVVGLLMPGEREIVALSQIYRNDFNPLLAHNLTILVTGAALSIVYRAGGLVLILAWNATHWADAIFSYLSQIYAAHGLGSAALTLAAILPHLLLEALAYVIAGLAGVFISIALGKYSAGSNELNRVARACLVLVIVAIATLAIATVSECFLAQPVFHSAIDQPIH